MGAIMSNSRKSQSSSETLSRPVSQTPSRQVSSPKILSRVTSRCSDDANRPPQMRQLRSDSSASKVQPTDYESACSSPSASMRRSAHLPELSLDVYVAVFSFLDQSDRVRCSLVSTRWRQAASHPCLWLSVKLYPPVFRGGPRVPMSAFLAQPRLQLLQHLDFSACDSTSCLEFRGVPALKSVTVHFEYSESDDSERRFFRDGVARCKALEALDGHCSLNSAVFVLCTATKLRHLDVTLPGNWEKEDVQFPPVPDRIAPLEFLALKGLAAPFIAWLARLPITTLKDLTIREHAIYNTPYLEIPKDFVDRLVARNPALENLTLEWARLRDAVPLAIRGLPSLRSLSLPTCLADFPGGSEFDTDTPHADCALLKYLLDSNPSLTELHMCSVKRTQQSLLAAPSGAAWHDQLSSLTAHMRMDSALFVVRRCTRLVTLNLTVDDSSQELLPGLPELFSCIVLHQPLITTLRLKVHEPGARSSKAGANPRREQYFVRRLATNHPSVLKSIALTGPGVLDSEALASLLDASPELENLHLSETSDVRGSEQLRFSIAVARAVSLPRLRSLQVHVKAANPSGDHLLRVLPASTRLQSCELQGGVLNGPGMTLAHVAVLPPSLRKLHMHGFVLGDPQQFFSTLIPLFTSLQSLHVAFPTLDDAAYAALVRFIQAHADLTELKIEVFESVNLVHLHNAGASDTAALDFLTSTLASTFRRLTTVSVVLAGC